MVLGCLRKSPAERFQTVADLRATLELASGTPVEKTASIAVLPFANMSRDADDEYFSDGLGEEIINALTQIAGLIVIARTSAFAFKGKNEDIRRIAETLGGQTFWKGACAARAAVSVSRPAYPCGPRDTSLVLPL